MPSSKSSTNAPDDSNRLDSRLDGRYKILGSLGQGAFAGVYRVEDLARGPTPVALKLLHQADAGQEERLRREFLWLRRLRHACLPEAYDFGKTHDGRAYFTERALIGRPLHELPVDAPFELLHELVRQILDALAYLHSRGILHRDLKPSHLLWREPGPAAFVIDLGLAETIGGELQATAIGTPLYTAPEIARGLRATPRSDLYSLGVVLYEVLSGQPPFQDPDPAVVLRMHLDGEAPPPRSRLQAPSAFLAFVARLMSKNPERRFASAGEALELLDGLLIEPRPGRTSARGAPLFPGAFVGRQAELGALLAAMDSLRPGGGRIVLVSGESGAGKTRLLEEFQAIAQVHGAGVASASCQNLTSAPFQTLELLLRQLGLGLELHAFEEGREASLAEPLLELLAKHCQQGGRLVLIFDELHHGSAAFLSTLGQICRSIADLPILILGSYLREAIFPAYVWEDGSVPGHLISDLAALPHCSEILLGGLDTEAIGLLGRSILGSDLLPEGLPPLLLGQTDGLPLALEESLRTLFEEGFLIRRAAGWSLEVATGGRLRLPGSLREIFERRLSRVSAVGWELAELACVLKRRAAGAWLARLWEARGGDFGEALHELLKAGVLQAEEAGGQTFYRLAHSALQEILYQALPPERRQELHLRAARFLEALPELPLEEKAIELERHYCALQDPQKALLHGRQAAEAARRAFAYERAIESLERCRRLESSPERSIDLLIELADLTILLGQFDRAGQLHEQALTLAQHERPERTPELLRRQGELHHGRGQFRLALDCLAQALERLPGAQRAECLASMAGSLLALGRLEEARSTAQEALELAQAQANKRQWARSLEILARAASLNREFDRAAGLFTECLELWRKEGDNLGAGRALTWLGIVADLAERPERGIECFHAALELYEKARFLQGQAEVYRSLGRLHHTHRTSWELAADYYRRSLAILERTGDDYGIGRSCYALGQLHEDRGQFERAIELYLRDLAIVNQIKDYAAIGRVLLRLGHVWLLRSEPVKAEFYLAQARAKLEKAERAGIHLLPLVWATRALCSIQTGQFEEARARVDKALQSLTPDAPPAWRGRVLLARAELLRCEGRPEESLQSLALGYELMRRHGTTAEQIFASLARGRCLMLQGSMNEEARRYLEEARELLAQTGSASTLHEIERRIAEIGRAPEASEMPTLYPIASLFHSTLELRELLEQVLKTAAEHLQPEYCCLFSRDEFEGGWKPRASVGPEAGPEAERARWLASSGRLDMAATAGAFLCVPLRASERAWGAIYLERRQDQPRFTEQDFEFLRILAGKASRAIENSLFHERYKATMNSLNAGILVLDSSGRTLAANRSFEERFGEACLEVLRTRQAGEREVELELPSGKRQLRIRTRTMEAPPRNLLGTLCFVQDLTPLRQLQELLARESRLTAMGDLATRISERMKGYLQEIRALARTLEARLQGDPRSEYVQELLLEVQEADRYVSEHLSPSTNLSGWRETPINRLAREVAKTLEAEARPRGIELKLDLSPHNPVLRLRPSEMREALLNLVRNAIQAQAAAGHIWIRTRTQDRPDGQAFVAVSVQDQGPGIPPELRARIFEPFFTTKPEGHGVGLWMAHNVVRDHQGSIELESQPGQGSTFTVLLPLNAK